MPVTLKPIRKLFLGGSNSYYISKDKNYFVKVNRGRREWIIKEYMYLRKYWNKIGVENLQLIEPIYYSKKNEFLVTKYVNCKKLVDLLNPNVYYQFGNKLRLFHKKGYSHSHLEIHDILYDNKTFFLADVPFFNEREQIHDLVSILLTINLYRLKRPWHFYRYSLCLKEFLRGYGPFNSMDLEKEYHISIHKRIRLYNQRSITYKIKAFVFKSIHRIGLL